MSEYTVSTVVGSTPQVSLTVPAGAKPEPMAKIANMADPLIASAHEGSGSFKDAFTGLRALSDQIAQHVNYLKTFAPPGFELPEFVGFKNAG
jgi:hypothetical protein